MATTKRANVGIDQIEHVDGGYEVKDVKRGDEQIIQDLQTHGEEVGMTWRTVMAVISMVSCYNAYVFTLVIPPAVLSLINEELGPDPRYTWITGAWNLGGAIFVTLGGRLSDIFGRRYFFLAGSVLLIIGAIISATGQSITQMIVGGAVFGAGSGFNEMSYGAVQELVPNKHRMITVGVFDIGAIIAQIMPLTVWGIIHHTGNWRAAYYLMIAFQSINVLTVFCFYNPPLFETKHRADGMTKMELLRRFDWAGLAFFTVGCTLFICGVSWGGSMYPWTSATTIAPIVIGFSTLVGLGFWETYGPVKEALLPPRLFKQVRHFLMPMLTMGVAGMQYYSNATLWPRLSQLLYAKGDIEKGLYAEALPLGSILGGLFLLFSKKIGHQRWQVFIAIALQTACVGAMSTATITNPAKSAILTVIISFTVSVVMLNCMVLVGFGIVNQDDIGTAVGLAGTSRLIFGGVAIAIFANVTNGKFATTLPAQVAASVEKFNFPTTNLPKLLGAVAAGTPEAFKAVPGITPAIEAATILANKQAYLTSAHLSYKVALAFGLCGCIAAAFIPSIDRRKYTDKTVAVQEADRKALEGRKKGVDGKA